MDYLVPFKYGIGELIEKRSRFIGQVWPVDSEIRAKELIAETKSKHYDARHNCWCYIIRDDGIVRYTDDREPQGTAGQPMVEVFRRGGIENVLCVVTRYFGGVLLGAGGLTRAYANTAKMALDDAGIAHMKLWTCLRLICPYNLFDRIKNEIEAYGGVAEGIEYGADVTVNALFPEKTATSFETRLADLSAGTVTAEIAGEKYIPVAI